MYTLPLSSHERRQELLCFIATFFWARTTEKFDKAGRTFKYADIRTVATNLAEKLPSLTVNANIAGPAYSEDNLINHAEIVGNAEDESLLYMIYERRLLLGYQRIIDTLTHILISDQASQDVSDLGSLYDELNICIQLFLRYTAKNIAEVRELQSLKWMIEAILQEDTSENRISFRRIWRVFASFLECRLGNLISNSVENRLESVSITWGHPWSKKYIVINVLHLLLCCP